MTTLKEFSEGMDRKRVAAGCVVVALAVAAGAFGAHALQTLLDERYRHTYETAVTYHFYHAFALILSGILYGAGNTKAYLWAGRFFIAGLLLFCGSLYLLCLLTAAGYHQFRWLGMITPLGGLSFIFGWLQMARAIFPREIDLIQKG